MHKVEGMSPMRTTADDPSRPPPGPGLGLGVDVGAFAGSGARHRFVVVASRLPVDRTEGPDGAAEWRPSPGGLVSALEPVMRESGGVWIGWSGDAGPAPGPFRANDLDLVGSVLDGQPVVRAGRRGPGGARGDDLGQ